MAASRLIRRRPSTRRTINTGNMSRETGRGGGGFRGSGSLVEREREIRLENRDRPCFRLTIRERRRGGKKRDEQNLEERLVLCISDETHRASGYRAAF